MFGKEFFHSSVEIKITFWAFETMTLIRINDVSDFALCLSQR